jgi:hypothetical protein
MFIVRCEGVPGALLYLIKVGMQFGRYVFLDFLFTLTLILSHFSLLSQQKHECCWASFLLFPSLSFSFLPSIVLSFLLCLSCICIAPSEDGRPYIAEEEEEEKQFFLHCCQIDSFLVFGTLEAPLSSSQSRPGRNETKNS